MKSLFMDLTFLEEHTWLFAVQLGCFTLQEIILICNPGADSLFAEGTTAQGKMKDV